MADNNIQSLQYILRTGNGGLRSFETEVNKETGASVTYERTGPFQKDAVLRSDSAKNPDGTKTFKSSLVGTSANASTEEKKFLLESVDKQANNQRAAFVNKNFTEPQKAKIFKEVPGVKNTTKPATAAPTDAGKNDTLDISATQQSLNDLGSGIGAIGRESYPTDLRYPKQIKSDQDRIIFNMIKYVPTKANLSNIPTSKSVFSRGEATNYIGTVTMAIQGPITDMNLVGWNDGNMNAFQALGAAAALTTIENGAAGAKDFTDQFSSMISGNNAALNTAAKAFFAGQAVQNQELFTRTTGAIANPNLELLFQAPQLREFTFNFLLSPRDEPESIEIKKIIRFFKQGMSVKRASTGVFLKTPNTFKLQYRQKGDDAKGAKFLPQIKECALQNFGVNYTPAQNYSTFNNNSMTAYEINMTFKELIPIYDDDYKDLDGNSDEYIGY